MKLRVLVVYLLAFICVGCVNFDKMAEETAIDKNESESIILEVDLGDVNGDRKAEKLCIENNILKLISGSRTCEKFLLEEDFNYESIKAYVANIDNDAENEIIALIGCSDKSVYNVRVINQTTEGEFELFDFPEEIISNEAVSGVNANIEAIDDFKYKVCRGDFETIIDVSRVYNLSMLSDEDYERKYQEWQAICQSQFQGEVLGIRDVYIINEGDGSVVLQLHQYITGGDDYHIGQLVCEIAYNSDGSYELIDIDVRERIDVSP